MKRGAGIAAGIVVAVVAATGGYWRGRQEAKDVGDATVLAAPNAAEEGGRKERKPLHYRNPMGLPDTSPVPKKDPMGMDYVPVYTDEEDSEPVSANEIKISTDKVQMLGVRTEPAQLRALDKVVRAAGRIEPDERRVYAIVPKFEGYVERLHVNVTGQPVGRGQLLFEVYSPELVSAQREYAIAAQGVEALMDAGGPAQAGMKQLAESSLMRLKNWAISEEQVKSLAKSGEAKRTLTFRSPVTGIVTEKKAVQGMRFMPGEVLYQVADLSSVWVLADVFEQDIGMVRSGAKARVKINAYPDKTFEGTITYIYPTLEAETRTVPVRVELSNPGQLLKPAMFAEVELPAAGNGRVVTVPVSAVIDSGTRRIVLVQASEGRYEPREVKLGQRSDQYVEVVDGVQEGEPVVVAANFLIDAESNLKAAMDGFGHAAHGSAPAQDGVATPAPDHLARPASQPAAAGHRAEGTVTTIDPNAHSVTVDHSPVASLGWPAMTMEFQAANPSLLTDLEPGAAIAFEFIERKPGEWVITAIRPIRDAKGAAAAADSHADH